MKRSTSASSAMRLAIILAIIVASLAGELAGCSGGDGPTGPEPGEATVGFVAEPVNLPYISLSRGKSRFDHLQLIGNMQPPPPQQGQPPPPDGSRPPMISVDFDTSTGGSATFMHLPQGLYSRVRFLIGRTSLDGTWRGTPFHVSLAPFGTMVDIRASTPQELGLDHDLAFQVEVDLNRWFPPYIFDGATLDDRGEIICDDVTNVQIAGALTQAMPSAFSLP